MLFTRRLSFFAVLLFSGVFLAGCSQATPEPVVETIVETIVVTKEVAGETIVQVVTATPQPEVVVMAAAEPRTLNICQGQEPETLYPYGGRMLASALIQDAFWDGPIDSRSFDYQPVILQKIPNLADGDAVIQAVEVSAGDLIIDNNQDLVNLETDVVFRPSGCNSSECATPYDGTSTVTMDQLVATFQLVPGITWSDGTPLTTQDSVYSFELNKDPDTPASKYGIERTSAYEALDDITIQWTGVPGFMDATYFLNFWTPYPEHVWGEYTAEELIDAEESSKNPLGWGPYVMEEWVPGESIVMRKNENYFRADEGLPKFDTVIYKFVGENANASIAKILSGECDIVDQTARLDSFSELLFELHTNGQLNASFVTGTSFEHVDFGIRHISYDDEIQPGDRPDFFGDVRTRQAFAHCMDRQAVVDNLLFGQSVVLDSYLPTDHPLYNSEVAHYDFDVALGSALLEEAGWTMEGSEDGIRRYVGENAWIPQDTPLSVQYWTTKAPLHEQAVQILTDSMKQCGIGIQQEYWNPGEYYSYGPDGPIFGRRFELAQFAWLTAVQPPCDLWITEAIPGADPVEFPYLWGGTNNLGWSNKEFDEACKAALSTLPGQPGYEENHKLAQEIFADQVPMVPLYVRLKLAATRTDFCQFEMNPTANSEMWNIEKFDYGESCTAE